MKLSKSTLFTLLTILFIGLLYIYGHKLYIEKFQILLLDKQEKGFYQELNGNEKLHFLYLDKEEKYFYQKLKEFKQSDQEFVPLKELTNFDWDGVVVGDVNSEEDYDWYYKKLLFYKKNNLVKTINTYTPYSYKYQGCCFYFINNTGSNISFDMLGADVKISKKSQGLSSDTNSSIKKLGPTYIIFFIQ